MTFNYHLRLFMHSLAVLLILTTVLFYSIAESNAQELVCPPRGIIQITDTLDPLNEFPSISGDGRFVAFESNQNLTGQNPDGNDEIFLYDSLLETITQITNDPDEASARASTNGDGTRIAFQSRSNINGGNPAKINQIYVFDTNTSTFIQITNDQDLSSSNASIDAAGNRVAFNSSSDIIGQNPNNIEQIYIFDINAGTFIQITEDLFEDSRSPSISGDGNSVAFESDANINGGNPNNNDQIYFSAIGSGIIKQITPDLTDIISLNPSLNFNGQFLAFRSNGNINGTNPEENTEIFLADTIANTITTITITEAGDASQLPSINANGTRIAFESDGDFGGQNPDDVREIWIVDLISGVFTQITNVSSGLSENSSIDAEGLRVAFNSRSNVNGGNPQEVRQVYLARCLDPNTFRNIPTLSEWGLIAMSGVLGIIGLFAIRRRKLAA